MVLQNAPVLTSPFVGRRDELAEVARLLSDPDCRLVTLVGPGGTGKTRLALEAAERLVDKFNDGIYFIPLQALGSADALILAIGESLRFQFFAGGERRESLMCHLAEKKLLLILDNSEHMTDEMAVISEILAAAPNLKILVTSRERLNLVEEWVYEVGGLSFPHSIGDGAVEDFSAVQLFAQNARRVQPSFSLEREQSAITRICTLVQGMPLALELAAAWTRVLSCAEIAVEIERGLDILETSARNVAERHRSMRAVLQQSWARLADGEQAVVRKLALFRGGFTREAAAAVAGASIHALSALVDKSWLYRSTRHGRFDMHELVRQFAEERLAESGEGDTVQQAYALHFADLVQRCEAGIKFRRQSEALGEMDRDFENIRAAWHWSAERHDAALSSRMLEGVSFFCDMRARFYEGAALFGAVAAHFAKHDTALYHRARTRRTRMIMLGMLADDLADAELEREMHAAVEFARAQPDRLELAIANYVLAIVQSVICEEAAATENFLVSLDLATELNDRFYMAEFMAWLGVMLESVRDSQALHMQAVAIQREIGDLNGLGWNLLHLSEVAFWFHHLSEAESYAAEAEAIQRERGDLKGLSWCMLMGSKRAILLDRFDEAQARAAEAERIALQLSLPSVTQSTLGWVGLLKIVTESDYAEGERLCRQALEIPAPQQWGMGDTRLNAMSGLLFAAVHRGERDAARDLYAQLLKVVDSLGIDVAETRCAILIPLAVALLVSFGEDERAVVLLARLNQFQVTEHAMMFGALGQLPVTKRIADELEERLGSARYQTLWRGTPSGDPDHLLADLRQLAHTLSPDQPSLTPPNPDALTEREREILVLLADGLSNRQIAAQLILALGTVKWYISEIYSKLGVTSRTQAIARARDLKLD